jgi:uncharacterized protein
MREKHMKRYWNFYLFVALIFAYTTATQLFAFDDAKDSPAIFQAASSNKFDKVKALIDSGMDVNVVYDRNTPLCAALLNKNYDIAKLIIQSPKVAVDKRCIVVNRNGDDWTRTPLIIAAQMGQTEIVDLLLKKGADINGRDQINDEPLSGGSTALIYAAGFDHLETLLRLLNNSKKPNVLSQNKSGFTALWYASRNENLEMTKILFNNGSKINIPDSTGASILTTTIEHKNYDVLDFLVSNGADINFADKRGFTPLMTAIGFCNKDEDKAIKYIEKFLTFKPKLNYIPIEDSALHVATRVRSVGTVKLLLDNGANIDITSPASKRTALYTAAISKNMDVGKYLIKRGAKIEIPDNVGYTPLIAASIQADPEMVQLLVESGASINVRPSSNILLTPLVIAAANIDPFKHEDSVSIIKILLDNKADINFQAGNGRTALIAASQSSNYSQAYEKAALLIDKGAKLDIVNNKGETALMLAISTGNNKLAKLLVDSGAKIDLKNGAGESAMNYAARYNNQEISTTLASKGAASDAPSIKQQVTIGALIGSWQGYQDGLPQALYKLVLTKDGKYDFMSRFTPEALKQFPAGSIKPVIAAHKGKYTINNDILILYPTGTAPVSMNWKLENSVLILDSKIRLKK